ncbi:TPA: hypothetical protein V0O35_000063 [Streptococcus pneumoniae]|uniref:Oligosaccharide repeat unit polymerase Wzy n=2 Tax=Streptococcus pneumoniae TaxID=1313 RepID=Q4K2R9_STREE|nr:hypothetical protein [Streptococcus pneumoniae]EJG83760.1 putative membrane protein [Streptococcus pneumoniae SPAR95]MBW5063866.1 hypothetical protein [Streptococcus pneumoniae]MBW5222204.1 hypothetical protein [Streptococcus pneumoniae]MDG7304629.1 hypothetical protein [Streptococcus pneumoniae]MDG7533014.1 hypothetical protein [Streptococcus pneumoniae]
MKKSSTLHSSTLHIGLILFLIVLSKNFFNLVPNIALFSDFNLMIIIIIMTVVNIKYYNRSTKYQYRWYIIFTLIFVLYSAINEKLLYGQPFLLGLLPQRQFFLCLMTYFPLRKYFQEQNISLKKLYVGIMNLGSISSLIYILQKIVILYGGTQFVNVIYSFAGYFSGYRLYVGSSLIILATLISTAYFLETLKLKYLCHLILGWFTQIWITQGRIEMIVLLISTIVCIIVQGRLTRKKIIYWLLTILGLWMITLTPIFENIVGAILKVDGAGRGSDSLTIRAIGRQLYWEQLNETTSKLLFGTGYPNYNYALAFQRTGFSSNIFLTDNGFMTYIYIFGIVGSSIMGLLFLKYLKNSIKYARQSADMIPLMYIISLLIVAYNIILWYWNADGTFILVIMICALEHGEQLLHQRNGV